MRRSPPLAPSSTTTPPPEVVAESLTEGPPARPLAVPDSKVSGAPQRLSFLHGHLHGLGAMVPAGPKDSHCALTLPSPCFYSVFWIRFIPVLSSVSPRSPR